MFDSGFAKEEDNDILPGFKRQRILLFIGRNFIFLRRYRVTVLFCQPKKVVGGEVSLFADSVSPG
jgi:hypothetical protein